MIVIFDIDVVIWTTSEKWIPSAHIPPQSRPSTVAEVAGARLHQLSQRLKLWRRLSAEDPTTQATWAGVRTLAPPS